MGELAANAFEESVAACKQLELVAHAHPPAGQELLVGTGPVALAVLDANRRSVEFAARAVDCWLLLATSEDRNETERRACWNRAEVLFKSVRRHADATSCAARAGNMRPKEVLD